MNEIQTVNNTSMLPTQEITIENRLEIIEEGMRRKYLSRLSEMQIAPLKDLPPLESDLIDNYRLYRITEMVYHKGEPATNKFTTVFNTLSTYNASVFIIIDSDGINTEFYLGVRNNEKDESKKRSTVTLGDTLKNTLIGHFPGIKIETESRHKIAELSEKIQNQHNVASVSVVGTEKTNDDKGDEHFVQGLEKPITDTKMITNSEASKFINLSKTSMSKHSYLNYDGLYLISSPTEGHYNNALVAVYRYRYYYHYYNGFVVIYDPSLDEDGHISSFSQSNIVVVDYCLNSDAKDGKYDIEKALASEFKCTKIEKINN